MRNLIILTVVFLFFRGLLSQAPNVEGFVPLGVDYNCVEIIDENTFIAAGTNGAVIISRDGGLTWNKRYFDSGENIVDIINYNGNILLLSNEGSLYSSIDNAITFSLLNKFSGVKSNSIDINSKGIGLIACDNSFIFYTSDGGNTWIKDSVYNSINFKKALINDYNQISITLIGGGIIEFIWGERSNFKFFSAPSSCMNCLPINPQYRNNVLYTMVDSILYKKNFSEDFERVCEVSSMNNFHILNDNKILFYKKTRWSLFDAFEYNFVDKELKLIANYSDNFLVDNLEFKEIDYKDNIVIGVGARNSIFLSKDYGYNFKQMSYYNVRLNGINYDFNVKVGVQCSFINENTFFSNGGSANLYKTTDGGATFTTQNNILKTAQIHPLEVVHFNNEKVGFGFLDFNYTAAFMRTRDGGNTYEYKKVPWASSNLLKKIDDNKFIFIHYNEVYQGFSKISSTKDFFDSYTDHYLDTSWVKDFEIVNEDEIVFCSVRPTDQEKLNFDCILGLFNFKTDSMPRYKNIPKIKNLYSMHRFDSGEILIYGRDYDKVGGVYKNAKILILKSKDNGITWSEVHTISRTGFNDKDFFVEGDTVNFYDVSQIIYSTDKGETWNTKPRFLINSKELITSWTKQIGNSLFVGTIKLSSNLDCDINIYKSKTDKDIITSVENQVESKPIWWVSNPYPNPYTNVITLDYAYDMMYSQKDFKFTLYNVLGVKIADLVPDFSLSNGNQGKVSLNIPYSNQLFYLHINFKGTNKVYPIFGISN